MHMGIVSKLLGHDAGSKRHAALGDQTYLDLGEMDLGPGESAANVWVKVGEITKLDDFKEFAHHVYDGHVLVLDIRKIQSDEILLRRFTSEARKLATDVQGDVAGVADGLIMVTPGGVRIDKHKMRVAAAAK